MAEQRKAMAGMRTDSRENGEAVDGKGDEAKALRRHRYAPTEALRQRKAAQTTAPNRGGNARHRTQVTAKAWRHKETPRHAKAKHRTAVIREGKASDG